jgi:hypothetical protein
MREQNIPNHSNPLFKTLRPKFTRILQHEANILWNWKFKLRPSHTAFVSSQKINAARVQRGQAGHQACIFDLPL